MRRKFKREGIRPFAGQSIMIISVKGKGLILYFRYNERLKIQNRSLSSVEQESERSKY